MMLKQMRLFCAVCRTGSFTKAADENFISQSSVSQSIKALEKDLGIELLDRRGHSFCMTPAGEHFYQRATAILEEIDDLRFETEGIANGYATRLRVGYLDRYDGWEFQGAVAAFTQRHPHIEVDVRAGSHDGIYRLLEAGEVDILFNDRRRALSDDYENVPLMSCHDFVMVSGVSPFASRESLSVADLRGGTCILIASPGQEEVEQAYYRDVLNFHCDFVFAQTREQGMMMVAGNRGFMPLEARDEVRTSGTIVRRIPLMGADGVPLAHDYYAFWIKNRTNTLVEEFAAILKEAFAQG